MDHQYVDKLYRISALFWEFTQRRKLVCLSAFWDDLLLPSSRGQAVQEDCLTLEDRNNIVLKYQ